LKFVILTSNLQERTKNEHFRSEVDQIISCILKANSSWSPTWAKFCQLIASLPVILPQLNLTELKLEYLKFGF